MRTGERHTNVTHRGRSVLYSILNIDYWNFVMNSLQWICMFLSFKELMKSCHRMTGIVGHSSNEVGGVSCRESPQKNICVRGRTEYIQWGYISWNSQVGNLRVRRKPQSSFPGRMWSQWSLLSVKTQAALLPRVGVARIYWLLLMKN